MSHRERRGAAVLIQRTFRSFILVGGRRRKEQAATMVQSTWKGFVQRKR